MLLLEFGELWDEVEKIWDREQDTDAFRAYVSADFFPVYQSLLELQGHAETFLEWGSGLGVVTIMASRLGFDAYGIEAVPELVEYSESLAKRYGNHAQFAQGSFIPDAFEWSPSNGDNVVETFIDVPDGYADLDMDLRDFDLIYAYPWPDEHGLFHNIIREFGSPHATLISYDAREGTDIVRFGIGLRPDAEA